MEGCDDHRARERGKEGWEAGRGGRRGTGEGKTHLLDVDSQLGNGSCDETLLVLVQLSERVDLRYTLGLLEKAQVSDHAQHTPSRSGVKEKRVTHPNLHPRTKILQPPTPLSNLPPHTLPPALIRTQTHITRHNNPLLPPNGPQNFRSELGSGVGHGERGGSGAVFRFDDFVAAELDAFREGFEGGGGEGGGEGVGGLGEEGDDLG